MTRDPNFQADFPAKPQVEGQNLQNNLGGENYQSNYAQAPTILGGTGNTINLNYYYA